MMTAKVFSCLMVLYHCAGQMSVAQPSPVRPKTTVRRPDQAHIPQICKPCIRAHEEFLASDAMQGRGSGTHDELVAATYVASQLRAYGIEPAGDNHGYLQRASLVRRKLVSAPRLEISEGKANAGTIVWKFGTEFLVRNIAEPDFSGPLQKINADDPLAEGHSGAILLISGTDKKKIREAVSAASSRNPAAILALSNNPSPEHFKEASADLPRLPTQLDGKSGSDMSTDANLLALTMDAMRQLEQVPENTMVHFVADSVEEKAYTWNAIGILHGRDPALSDSVILLSAHIDHLGRGKPVNGDDIYNGADDDASGTVAVLELARVLGREPRPRRTIIFALFGSEELGGLGSTYFREHPPVPIKTIGANLEFEMIGRPDAAVKPDTLWLTGWERSNLGPALASHGARLVADPHPGQNFFMRSDNYVLAKKGVVAQTVSSYGLHTDYHQPSDDLEHMDFRHMNAAIGSLLGPVGWLANSSFTPTWNKGEQP